MDRHPFDKWLAVAEGAGRGGEVGWWPVAPLSPEVGDGAEAPAAQGCRRGWRVERITGSIHVVRGVRVMLDMDLAVIYGVLQPFSSWPSTEALKG